MTTIKHVECQTTNSNLIVKIKITKTREEIFIFKIKKEKTFA
jgi:competence protein ComGF